MTAPRILMVTHYFPYHGGGVELVAGHVAEQFAEQFDFQVIWYASACDASPSGTEGMTCVSAPACNAIEHWFGVPYPLWSPRALIGLWCETRRASAVYVHDFIYGGNLAACFFAVVQRKPLLITQHIGFVPYRSCFLRGLLSLLNHTLGAWALGRADQVVFVSHAVQDYFARFVHFRWPPLVIANGVDTSLFKPADAERRAVLRAELGVTPGQPLLLFVGRFVEKKGLPILEELARHFSHCHWVFAGKGPLDPAGWGRPNVRVLRNVPQEALVPLYQAADLLVLPSKGEGFPLVVQEAMACGTPVMVGEDTAAGCSAASLLMFVEKVGGDDTASRWARRLSELHENPHRLLALRSEVAKFAQEHWSWKRTAAEYAKLLDSIELRKPAS